MISEPTYFLRLNRVGKPYVQNTDPSLTNSIAENDIWLNPSNGTMQTWNGTSWDNMQFGGNAIMDNAIANRMIANDISASKITVGTLQSQDGDVYINLENGEAKLTNLEMGGQVEGNIIATSSNGLTRVRLRGREGEKDITAGLIFEQRANTNTDVWSNAGQIYFAYTSRNTYAVFQNFQIGKYNASRPSQAYNAGTSDGLMWRSTAIDWMRASYLTYHGLRLAKRNNLSDTFENITPVLVAVGNVMSGASIVVTGTVTCTYQINEVMKIDFNLKVTTAGSGTGVCGISPTLIRTLNAEIPYLTPVSGGVVQIYNSSGALQSYAGASLVAENGTWKPIYITDGAQTDFWESTFSANMMLVGTCYATYVLNDEE